MGRKGKGKNQGNNAGGANGGKGQGAGKTGQKGQAAGKTGQKGQAAGEASCHVGKGQNGVCTQKTGNGGGNRPNAGAPAAAQDSSATARSDGRRRRRPRQGHEARPQVAIDGRSLLCPGPSCIPSPPADPTPPAWPPRRRPRGRGGSPFGTAAALVGVVVLALAVLIVETVLLALSGRRGEPKPEAAAPAAKSTDATRAELEELTRAVHALAAASKNADEPKPVPSPNQPTKPDAPPAPHLETVGLLAGVHLYQTHLNIGLLADAAESDVYTTEEANKLLDGVVAMMDTVDMELAGAPDRDASQKARDVAGLLRTEAAELRAYWDNGDQDHVDRFHKAREQAWAGVKTFLHIED